MQTGLSEAEAYRALQKRARDGRQSLREVAKAVLAE
jgi:AmiR/NasT family two-component response regulator